MEHIRRLPMSAIKFFFFVAHYGSMTEAAKKLCVTHGAVSKQIKLLEGHLGVALFSKQGRRLVLTPAGRQLFAHCEPLFRELERYLSQLSGQQGNTLIVSCEPTIAMRWLIPRCADFKQQYNVDLIILAAGGAVNFAQQRIDVAIRRDDFVSLAGCDSQVLVKEQIGRVQSVHGCAPVRLHTQSRPSAWSDWLVSHQQQPLHAQRSEAGFDPNTSDTPVIAAQAKPAQTFSQEVYFEHFYLSIQAAISGLGQTIASKLMVIDDLEQKILVAPEGFKEDGSHYVLISENPIADDRKKQNLLTWLRDNMAQSLQLV